MEKLIEAVREADLSIGELAIAISNIVKEDYGKHNFEAFKEIVNDNLK